LPLHAMLILALLSVTQLNHGCSSQQMSLQRREFVGLQHRGVHGPVKHGRDASGIRSDAGIWAHRGTARPAHGTLRLRGGVTRPNRHRRGKDPAEIGIVPLADSMTNNWYSKQVNMRETLGPWVSDLDIEQYMALQENWQPGDKRIPKMPGSGTP